MKNRMIMIIATFFYIGYLPVMPGTWASMAAAFVYIAFKDSMILQIILFASLFFSGLYASGKAEVLMGRKDDKRIVIDEASGMFLLYILIPKGEFYLLAGFLLFRVFDVFKIAPMRRLERLPGAWGIMSDDILAALYSYVAIFLFTFIRNSVF
ncbi:MAG: phosphatidylglycerophosphatase A [Candidatus Omnitrophica bacterium]|nr:phosphatidylglycerophosphatase A [Candidatus Omnitrophota bacterium]